MMGFVYILELAAPLGNERHSARFYIGWTAGTVEDRLKEHRVGRGAAFTRAANERGITYKVVATFPGGRDLERKMKRQKNTPRLVRSLQGAA